MVAIHLEKGTSVALHRQCEQQIRDAIREGRLHAGDILSPEPALARQIGVARATLRQALQQLVREGLLRRVRGHGTFVSESAIAAGVLLAHTETAVAHAAHTDAGPTGAGSLPADWLTLARAVEDLRDEVRGAAHRQEARDATLMRENALLRQELASLKAHMQQDLRRSEAMRDQLAAQRLALAGKPSRGKKPS